MGYNRLEGSHKYVSLTNLTAQVLIKIHKGTWGGTGVQTMRNYKVWEINIGGLTNLERLCCKMN